MTAGTDPTAPSGASPPAPGTKPPVGANGAGAYGATGRGTAGHGTGANGTGAGPSANGTHGATPTPSLLGPGGVLDGIDDGRGWRRLHPLSPVVRLGEAYLGIVGLIVGSVTTHRGTGALLGCAALLVATLVLGYLGWRVTRWQLADTTLHVESGVLRRRSIHLPYAQIQAVDVVQPAVGRLLGLAELRLRTAAAPGTAGRLTYLPLGQASRLREQILELARGGAADDRQAPERPLATVARRTLLASLVLDPGTAVLVLWVAGMVVAFHIGPVGAGLAVLGGGFGFCADQAKRLWQRLNAGYDLTVAEVPDGLRTRSGFLTHATETIPRGRVQAARIVRPLLWRPFGWSAVQLEVAGAGLLEGQGSPDQRRTLRAVLPVGHDEEARQLLHTILAEAPAPSRPAPLRARWKAPRSYRWLSWGCSDDYAVTRTGRFRRAVTWVPLAKVQGVRLVQGPLQRRLGLASVRLDTAGRAVRAVLRDRDVAEAGQVVDTLPARCRQAAAAAAARTAAGPVPAPPARSSSAPGVP